MARNAIESAFRSSKMAAGSHFVKKIKVAYWSEMARNAIKSAFRSSKMAAGSHFVNKNKSCILIWNGAKCELKVIFGHPKWPPAAILWKKIKLRIYLKWREMRSKVIFCHPKWPPAAILWKKNRSKLRIDLKWREMRSKVIFGHQKWPPAAILWLNIKVAYWSEMATNAIESYFWSSKMGGGASQWLACKPFGDIHSICPWANTPILVIIMFLFVFSHFLTEH